MGQKPASRGNFACSLVFSGKTVVPCPQVGGIHAWHLLSQDALGDSPWPRSPVLCVWRGPPLPARRQPPGTWPWALPEAGLGPRFQCCHQRSCVLDLGKLSWLRCFRLEQKSLEREEEQEESFAGPGARSVCQVFSRGLWPTQRRHPEDETQLRGPSQRCEPEGQVPARSHGEEAGR